MKGTLRALTGVLKEIDVDEFWAIDVSKNDICLCADYLVERRKKIERVLKVKLKLNVKNNWYVAETRRGLCKIRVIVWCDD